MKKLLTLIAVLAFSAYSGAQVTPAKKAAQPVKTEKDKTAVKSDAERVSENQKTKQDIEKRKEARKADMDKARHKMQQRIAKDSIDTVKKTNP